MTQTDSKTGFLDRNYFLLRRLHSLTGIMPIGVFLISHLLTNASIVWGRFDSREAAYGHAGAAVFQKEVNFIHSLPFLLLIEIFGLWLPIAFHAALGVVYAMSGKPNNQRYAYQDNWRYTLQRISGYVGIAFIFYHLATLRWGWTFLIPGGTQWSAEFAGSTLAQVMQGGPDGVTFKGLVVALFYFVGVSLLVFHFANGLWTSAITWGLTISAKAQKRWGVACLGVGASLMALAWAAIFGFMVLDVKSAKDAEAKILKGPLPVLEKAADAGGSSDLARTAK
ncbi:MAG: hypothetical protein GC200_03035 [Tepidisphaera sp.]|nr:hypothetical protein [Tepidisphaera sp.]